jgi:hypothetical protein
LQKPAPATGSDGRGGGGGTPGRVNTTLGKFRKYTWVELTHTWVELTHTWVELTHAWLGLTLTWVELSHTWVELTHTWVELTHTWVEWRRGERGRRRRRRRRRRLFCAHGHAVVAVERAAAPILHAESPPNECRSGFAQPSAPRLCSRGLCRVPAFAG